MKIGFSPRREHENQGFEGLEHNNNSTQNRCKNKGIKTVGTRCKKHQFGDGFGKGFGRVWGGGWRPLSAFWATFDVILWCLNLECAWEGLLEASGLISGGVWEGFGMALGGVWECFGRDFRGFWVILGSSGLACLGCFGCLRFCAGAPCCLLLPCWS